MLPNECEKMSNDWWVMSYEWWVMSNGNWVIKKTLPKQALTITVDNAASNSGLISIIQKKTKWRVSWNGWDNSEGEEIYAICEIISTKTKHI